MIECEKISDKDTEVHSCPHRINKPPGVFSLCVLRCHGVHHDDRAGTFGLVIWKFWQIPSNPAGNDWKLPESNFLLASSSHTQRVSAPNNLIYCHYYLIDFILITKGVLFLHMGSVIRLQPWANEFHLFTLYCSWCTFKYLFSTNGFILLLKQPCS